MEKSRPRDTQKEIHGFARYYKCECGAHCHISTDRRGNKAPKPDLCTSCGREGEQMKEIVARRITTSTYEKQGRWYNPKWRLVEYTEVFEEPKFKETPCAEPQS